MEEEDLIKALWVSAEGYVTGKDDQTIDGIRDVEAQGWWKDPRNGKRYEFRADGSLYQMTDIGISDRIGQWWYDFPNDRDEDPNDHGTGEIAWSAKKR
ncbi:MAG: hypothetical protein F6K39_48130, partial [Okeania sp. SIO3B3]|nr:hypothetical protein [Okeania sp. SIO3B3]